MHPVAEALKTLTDHGVLREWTASREPWMGDHVQLTATFLLPTDLAQQHDAYRSGAHTQQLVPPGDHNHTITAGPGVYIRDHDMPLQIEPPT